MQAEESSDTENSVEGQSFQRGQNHQMGQMGGQMGRMQGGFDQQEKQSDSSQTVTTIKDYGTNTWILFGICVVVLAGGIIFVRKY